MRRQLQRIAGYLLPVLLLGSGCSEASGGAFRSAESPSSGPTSPTADVGVRGGLAGATRTASEVYAVQQIMPGVMAEPGEEKISINADGAGDEMGPPPSAPPPPPAQRPAPPPPPPSPPKPTADASNQPHPGEVSVIRGPLLVYTAQIAIAVFEVNTSLAQVEVLGKEMGGFLAKRDDASITIRVPVARFDETVKRVEKIGDMLHRNVTAEDVTEEFRDLEVRLKSARAVQERLTQLLAKATKVEESVLIEKELDRVSGEIDRVEGRMKFLRDRAAYSTITVSFQAKPKDMGPAGPFRLPGRWLYELGLGRLLRL